MTPQKIKLEIIEELFDNYYVKNPSKRAVKELGGCCYYNSNTGNKCAVGMCMLDDHTAIDMEQNYCGNVEMLVYQLADNRDQYLDDILKEEYRGHDLDFWGEVQWLHDCCHFWTEHGLTEDGLAELNKLKTIFV